MVVGGDEPVTEYATTVHYPDGHLAKDGRPSKSAGQKMMMPTGNDKALAQRRADFHGANGAAVQVIERTWTAGDWGPAQ